MFREECDGRSVRKGSRLKKGGGSLAPASAADASPHPRVTICAILRGANRATSTSPAQKCGRGGFQEARLEGSFLRGEISQHSINHPSREAQIARRIS